MEEYEAILASELAQLRLDNAELLAAKEALQEDLYCACEAYDSLEAIHNEVVAECNELSEQNGILKIDLSDTTEELDACMAELDIALDALTEAGLLPETEADELKGRFN